MLKWESALHLLENVRNHAEQTVGYLLLATVPKQSPVWIAGGFGHSRCDVRCKTAKGALT